MSAAFARHDFWATSFFAFGWNDHGRWAPSILPFLYELKAQQQQIVDSGIAPAAKSAQGLYESAFDLLDKPHPGLAALKQFIAECVRTTVAQMHSQEVSAGELEVEILDSWYHITNQGGYHDTHVHGGCSWCGIYYLQIGESGHSTHGGAPNGGSRFFSPLMRGGVTADYGNFYLGKSFIDPPIQDGMLLLFPAYLLHNGLPYRGSQDRVVIAFNSCTQRREPVR